MANNRGYSFDEDANDNSHMPASNPYRLSQNYHVSNPATYLADMGGQRSPSPISEVDDMSPFQHAQQRDSWFETRGIPMEDTSSKRLSAYERQRQESNPYPTNATPPIYQMAIPAESHVSLDSQHRGIPVPPPHTRLVSPFANQSYRSSYHDRSSSRDQSYPAERNSQSPEQGDPFATPRLSRHIPDAPAAAAGIDALDYGRPSPERLNTSYSGYADSAATNFRNSRIGHEGLGGIDPINIDDEDDDPFSSIKQGKRGVKGAAGVGAAAGAGGFLKGLSNRDASGQYGQLPGGSGPGKVEKSSWLSKQQSSNKRLKWMVGGLIILVIVLAIIGGVVGVLASKKPTTDSSGDPNANLTKNSPQIQALLNNKDLHMVFPGMDYTPQNSQYPACIDDPPSQAYVTQDIAVLSQLTPLVRLYGTDCNQTEMVLKAIDILELNDTMKVYAGVWLDTNTTTSTRQLNQLYDILDTYGADPFVGVIIGNEVLFRKDMTQAQLISNITTVRKNLASRGMSSLKVATSDLGSAWTAPLAEAVDVVMSNIHPFFGGVAAPKAAEWTWSFWQNNDVLLTEGLSGKSQVIAETGWPSGGGNYCTDGDGGNMTCANPSAGSVAGVSEMNTFMEEWVCAALKNGTDYFWFEAFDEPWKVIYNTPSEQWEDKWGLMDVNRTIKSGIQIPDCGGQVAKLPS